MDLESPGINLLCLLCGAFRLAGNCQELRGVSCDLKGVCHPHGCLVAVVD